MNAELLRKIKELSSKGVDGEKQNATDILQKLLKKHGISERELDEMEIEPRIFKIDEETDKFFIFKQVVASEMDGLDLYISKKNGKRVRNEWYVKCTIEQQVFILAKLNFYWNAYQEQLKWFQRAFVQENELYRKTGTGDELPEEDMHKLSMASLQFKKSA